MSTAHTPATAAIQRRLERWELQHLRLLAAQQAEQIEELQRRVAWAEDCAERWRDDALDMQEQLADSAGGQPGLTMGGRLVVLKPEADAAASVPAIGQPWPSIAGSLYAGIAVAEGDQPDGHIVLLPDEPANPLCWQDALKWAEDLGHGAHAPMRHESALLYANLQGQFDPSAWYWTSTVAAGDGSYAWRQDFFDGNQLNLHKSYEGRVRAVRRFAVQSFNPSRPAA
jgi:hypothetical protein